MSTCIELMREVVQTTELSQSLWVAFQRDWFGIKIITPSRNFRFYQFGKTEDLMSVITSWQKQEVFLYLPSINKEWWISSSKIMFFKQCPWAVELILSNFKQKEVVRQHPDYKHFFES